MYFHSPIPARLLQRAEFGSTTGDGGFLVAATLARIGTATRGTIQRQDLGFGVQFLDGHFEGVNGVAPNAAAAVRLLQRMSNLLVTDKVL